MLKKIEIAVLSVLACFAFAAAKQTQVLKIVPNPSFAGVRAQDSVVRVEWVRLSDAGSQSIVDPPVCGVYYAAAPAGGNLSRYKKIASTVGAGNEDADFHGVGSSKVTSFIPRRQGGQMGPGVYYVIVASVGGGGDTLYSDYFRLAVKSDDPPAVISPKASMSDSGFVKAVTDVAPLFRWNSVEGVPYYHLVLSDKPFFTSDGKPNVGVNIIWQAITPNTSITYGAPDPSNTVSAAPPPLAAGPTYSWMVLNNYGNRPEFTSWDVVNVTDGLAAGRFFIKAPKLTAPKGLSHTINNDRITLSWSNIDPNATSYLVNILREGSAKSFGMEGMGDFSLGILAWEATVPRGAGTGPLSVELDAAGTLDSGSYKWRVYALDSRGAATTSDSSASEFIYRKGGKGYISVATEEAVGGVRLPVSYVELRSEVVSGPAMTPLLFYTGSDGKLVGDNNARPFAVGTYRISAMKEGYFTYTTTVTVPNGAVNVTIPMSRPEAAIYGRVFAAEGGGALSGAKVTAVSSWGDTVYAVTDGSGGFTFACRAADWVVVAEKPDYLASVPIRVPLKLNADTTLNFSLAKGNLALSGVVRNKSGQPIMGALVRVLREGAIVNELTSTPQSGAYVFYLGAGVYTITAEKPGFAMYSRSVAVTGAMTLGITLEEGAVVVGGSIIGKSWVSDLKNGQGDYAAAPITSARVTFTDAADTFTVTSDAVYGRFSVSLPVGRDYKVAAAAAGFAAARDGALSTVGIGESKSASYIDTLYALATIKGRVTGGVPAGVSVDVIVYDYNDAARAVASGRVVSSGAGGGDLYEVRNIPDGSFRIGAGADGYFTRSAYSPVAVTKGKLEPNREFNFAMEEGNRSIRFDVKGYEGGGTVKVLSPLSRAIPFVGSAPGVVAGLDKAGEGDYVVGVVPADAHILELSQHKFTVSAGSADVTEAELVLPFKYTAENTEIAADGSGKVRISWPENAVGNANRIELFYRSEGSVRFDSVSSTNLTVSASRWFDVAPARDGCNLYYYFRIYCDNGDIHGSGNRLYSVFVKPDEKKISRVVVEPGVVDRGMRDTLVLPSSYQAVFTLKAFYGDQFEPVRGVAGVVSWSVFDSAGVRELGAGRGESYSYATGNAAQKLILRAVFEPASGYKMKSGASADTVKFPVRVTGQSLDSVAVLRKGAAVPIFNTETAGFRVEAYDKSGNPVTVLPPTWNVYPPEAGEVDGDGLFKLKPPANFVGMVRIAATVGGRRAEYKDPEEEVSGLRVKYLIRENGGVANTYKGMRVTFDSARANPSLPSLEVMVPRLTNFVYKGTENYRMADSIAFKLSFENMGAIAGNVALAFDIPKALRDAANSGDYEFKVAKWYNDSLRWIPLESSVAGGVVSAKLSRVSAEDGQLSRRARKAAARQASNANASALDSGLYALVLKTNKTALAVSISPHPFSPYIKPVKEYGPDAPLGTCIRVNVQAPDPFVKSVKVRVYNTTGKLVWGIEKLAAQTGENHFWWNGRTSGRGAASAVSEVVWTDDYYKSSEYNSRPLCRNGRYYVMAILTDMDGKQKRVLKSLVLMK